MARMLDYEPSGVPVGGLGASVLDALEVAVEVLV